MQEAKQYLIVVGTRKLLLDLGNYSFLLMVSILVTRWGRRHRSGGTRSIVTLIVLVRTRQLLLYFLFQPFLLPPPPPMSIILRLPPHKHIFQFIFKPSIPFEKVNSFQDQYRKK